MEDLKRNFRLAKIITILVVIIAILLVFISYKSCNQTAVIQHQLDDKQEKDLAIKSAIEKEATIISRKVDQFGAEHVTIDAREKVFPSSIYNSPVAVSVGILDTTAMALKIQKKQITDLTMVVSLIKAEKLTAQRQLDSLKREIFTYDDNYVKLKFTPKDTTSNKEAYFDFSYNDSVVVAQYWKRKFPLIGAKRSYIDVYSKDPRTTINSVRKFTVEQANPKFGLRLQLRSIYGITSHKFYAGPGLSFDFGRLNFVGFSYYNYSDNRWQNTLGINYDLIRF